jgi:hypothetical protein
MVSPFNWRPASAAGRIQIARALRAFRRNPVLGASSFHQADNQADESDNEKDEEQDFCNRCGAGGNAGEAEDGCDDCNDEKYDGVLKHRCSFTKRRRRCEDLQVLCQSQFRRQEPVSGDAGTIEPAYFSVVH